MKLLKIGIVFLALCFLSACGKNINFTEEAGLSKISSVDTNQVDVDDMDINDQDMQDIDDVMKDRPVNKIHQCGDKGKKVEVCHVPNDDMSKARTLCVGKAALAGHIMDSQHHGMDYLGRCN